MVGNAFAVAGTGGSGGHGGNSGIFAGGSGGNGGNNHVAIALTTLGEEFCSIPSIASAVGGNGGNSAAAGGPLGSGGIAIGLVASNGCDRLVVTVPGSNGVSGIDGNP